MNNNKGHEIVKEIKKIIMTNMDKKVNQGEFKNKLIIFTYYLKLFLSLSNIIKIILLNIFNLFIL